MGPPSYMRSVVDRNVVKRRMILVNRSHKLTVERNQAKKKTSSVYDCTVEDVEYICNSNSTLCLFYFAIFVVLLLS